MSASDFTLATGPMKAGPDKIDGMLRVPDKLCDVTHINIYLSGLGLTHSDYHEHLLYGIPNRIQLALTPPAFDKGHSQCDAAFATLDSQAEILCRTVADVHKAISRILNKDRVGVYLYGFSVGADLTMLMAMQLVAVMADFDGAYLADPNVGRDSCVFSHAISECDEPGSFLRKLLDNCDDSSKSADEVLILADTAVYFGKIVPRSDWNVLRQIARDVFENADSRFLTFAQWLMGLDDQELIEIHFSCRKDFQKALSVGVNPKLCSHLEARHFELIGTPFLQGLVEPSS